MARIDSKHLRVVGFLALSAAATACGSSTPSPPPGAAFQEIRSAKAYDKAPSVSAVDYASLVAGTNDFGVEIYRKVASKDENVFFSPLSTATALAMTYAGAKTNTEKEMGGVLHDGLGHEKYDAAWNKLMLDLASRNVAVHKTDEGDKSIKLALVDAAWTQKDFTFVPQYLDTLSVRYDAGVKVLDFVTDPEGGRGAINDWVKEKTAGKILDLLAKGTITSATRLVLTNALYFYGSWAKPFDVKATKDAPFHLATGSAVTVPTMNATGPMRYAEGPDYQAVDLGYDGGKLAMTIILPAAGKFADVRGKLSGAFLSSAWTSMASFTGNVSLALPKFRFTWGSQSLKDALLSLGMKDAFEFGKADFSGMEPTRSLYVADVIHKAFVGVDEFGTEAAAATAVIMDFGSVPTDPKIVTVNRPFLVVIHDETGAVLFLGQVFDPKAS